MDLQGKVAIVTGAGQGIGRAIALRFAADGAAVVVDDIKPDDAGAVADEIVATGGRARAAVADVTKSDQVRAMVAATLDEFG
ncbi:MAG: SDR family NAD(P)-dependent oxidoreductase, partial [Armatimonadetes bacterium]|nr:SDR family NAD(P)-dependent oxidoreductase [Armatimonadota bacterium]